VVAVGLVMLGVLLWKTAPAYPWFCIGYFDSKVSLYQESIQAYKRAIALQPDFPKAHYNLSQVYYTFGPWQEGNKEAKLAYQQAINDHPKKTWGYIGLGDVHGYDENDWATAIGAY
jgi:tetratricopeptide (TPR) repeat protein